MDSLAAYFNNVKNFPERIGKLSDLRIGYVYKIEKFERIKTKYGNCVVITLSNKGPSSYEYHPKRVFLPTRIGSEITDDMMLDYLEGERKISIFYKGLNNALENGKRIAEM